MKYFKPISVSLSPNVEKDDIRVALNLLIRPWLWTWGKGAKELEENFKNYLGVKYVFSFNSGRSAFYAILKAMGLPEQSDVLLQAFTCNAVPNPVLWAKLNPIYVDCKKDDFNIDIEDLKKKITPQAKVLVVQHTFGMPANMEEVMSIALSRRSQKGEGGCDPLILIEDCAHSLGAEFNGQKVGTFGKAAFFSFSRDKVISSVYGGIAVTNDGALAKKLQEMQKQFGMPDPFWILQQILHPILLNFIILPIYNFFDLGKLFLIASQVMHILSKAVSRQEKQGRRPDYFPKALPNGLAMMATNQFGKLWKFNLKRQKMAEFYYKELAGTKFELPKKFADRKNIFLRFTVKHPKAHEIIYESWHKQNILLGDWYTTPIAPFDTKIEEIKYKPGSCPNAEYLAKRTLNLPTHINISEKDAQRIVKFLKKYS